MGALRFLVLIIVGGLVVLGVLLINGRATLTPVVPTVLGVRTPRSVPGFVPEVRVQPVWPVWDST